ncbi:hypothetical protein MUK42_04745 [Musa troglodytarum]|uniref:Uncharacterized protein n=1 Tax=Musa troglodytarum TaxID=320322 RepID=A0A9E7JHX4_9LILI|nr:hypothetical protein MUK42_04745 [Musa troglodytarum]
MPDRRDSLQTVDLDQMLPHTGVGSSLVEFQDLDRGMCSVSSDKWDGMLSITTTVDLTVEHTENLGLRYNHLLQETDDIYLPLSLSNNERLLLSLKSYVLRHRNALDKECQLCFTSRDHLKFGTGVASNIQNVRGSGQIVEVAIVITSVQSQCCLWRLNYATSQMMYFQEFTPFSVSQSSIDALTSLNWQNYGLRLREIIMDRDGNAVLEWVDMPSFGNMDIAIHSDRNLIKKAVKIALDDLKAKYAGTLLSCRSVKIRNHVPDLSRTIASLILSSNDPEFHAMNDGKTKVERGSAPCLFECEGHLKEHCPEEKDDDSEEVNFDMELSQIQRLRSK